MITEEEKQEVDHVLEVWSYLVEKLSTDSYIWMGTNGENKVHLVIVAERIVARLKNEN